MLRQWANSVCVNVCMCVAASKMSGMGEEGAHERLHHCMLSCSKWEGEKCGGETEYAGKSSCLKRGREKYTGRDFFPTPMQHPTKWYFKQKKTYFLFFWPCYKTISVDATFLNGTVVHMVFPVYLVALERVHNSANRLRHTISSELLAFCQPAFQRPVPFLPCYKIA